MLFCVCAFHSHAQTVLEVGQSITFSPGNGWISSAEVSDGSTIGFAYITNNAKTTGVKVTGLKSGTAICKVYYINNNSPQSTSYTIEVIDLKSIILPQSLTLKLGDKYTFAPIIQDSRMQKYLLDWRCEDTNIASISNDQKTPVYNNWGQISGYNYVHGGQLEAKKVGNTRVICSYKGLSAMCQVNVEPTYMSEINFDNTNYEITAYQSLQLQPNVLPENATIKDLTWKSSDTSVAIVDSKGKITALKKGKSVITATATDGSMVMGNCIITVNPEEKDELNIDYKIDEYAQFSTKIERESPFTLNIQPPTSNWKIKSFDINGVNALDQLVNGVYSIDRVENSMNIETTFAYNGQLQFLDLTSGIESSIDNSAMSISKLEGQICIKNIKVGANVKIYTIGGQLMGSHICSEDSIMIDLAPNYYIIVVDNISFKIRI